MKKTRLSQERRHEFLARLTAISKGSSSEADQCRLAIDIGRAGDKPWAYCLIAKVLTRTLERSRHGLSDSTRASNRVSAAEAFMALGARSRAMQLYRREVRLTESFVYCITLAQSLLKHGGDRRLARAIYRQAIKKCEAHGLVDPITSDVEEEDNYEAEIAVSVLRHLGDAG